MRPNRNRSPSRARGERRFMLHGVRTRPDVAPVVSFTASSRPRHRQPRDFTQWNAAVAPARGLYGFQDRVPPEAGHGPRREIPTAKLDARPTSRFTPTVEARPDARLLPPSRPPWSDGVQSAAPKRLTQEAAPGGLLLSHRGLPLADAPARVYTSIRTLSGAPVISRTSANAEVRPFTNRSVAREPPMRSPSSVSSSSHGGSHGETMRSVRFGASG